MYDQNLLYVGLKYIVARPKNFKNGKYTVKVGQDNMNIGVVAIFLLIV